MHVPLIPLRTDEAAPTAGEVRPSPDASEVRQLGGLRDSAGLADFLRAGGGGEAASGVAVTPESAMRVGVVFRCTALISGAIATMPLDLKRRVGKKREDASDHPLWTVLRRKPNPWQTPSQFRRYLQACVLHRGNGYAQIVRGLRNRIIALIPLNPDRVQVVQNPADFTLSYTYTRLDGRTVTFAQAEILHLCGMTLDGVRGLSVLSYARESIGLSISTERYSATYFRNGTTIGGVIKHPAKLGKEGQENLRTSLETYRGTDNAHKNLILEEGMTYERMGMTAVDAQFIQTREFSQFELAMFFGVPPHMLGLTQKSTSFGNGLEHQGKGFVTYTLQDWLTMWEEAIGRDLIGEAETDLYARFNTGGLVRGDIKSRYAAYAVGRQWGWLSANDILALEDEDPIDGGNTYLSPQNMAPVGAATPEDDDDAPPPRDD